MRLVQNPLLHCLGCVLRVLSTLEQDLSILCSIHLSLDPDLAFRPKSSILVSLEKIILFLMV